MADDLLSSLFDIAQGSMAQNNNSSERATSANSNQLISALLSAAVGNMNRCETSAVSQATPDTSLTGAPMLQDMFKRIANAGDKQAFTSAPLFAAAASALGFSQDQVNAASAIYQGFIASKNTDGASGTSAILTALMQDADGDGKSDILELGEDLLGSLFGNKDNR